jgi:tetratricopeptide (TPR) repeat protein
LEAADRLVTRVEDDQSFNQPHMRQLRKKLLEDAIELYEAFLNEHGTDSVVRYHTAQATQRIAWIQVELGNYAEAETAYRHSIGLLAELMAECDSEPNYRAASASCQTSLACMLNSPVGRPKDAEMIFRQALPIHEKLVAEYPDVPAYRNQLAKCCQGLAGALIVAGSFDDAGLALRRAVALREKLAAQFPTSAYHQGGLPPGPGNPGRTFGSIPRSRRILSHASGYPPPPGPPAKDDW